MMDISHLYQQHKATVSPVSCSLLCTLSHVIVKCQNFQYWKRKSKSTCIVAVTIKCLVYWIQTGRNTESRIPNMHMKWAKKIQLCGFHNHWPASQVKEKLLPLLMLQSILQLYYCLHSINTQDKSSLVHFKLSKI